MTRKKVGLPTGQYTIRTLISLLSILLIFLFLNLLNNRLSHVIYSTESRLMIPQKLFPYHDLDKWNRQTAQGKNLMHLSKAVIATTLRDAAKEVIAIRPMVERIASQFKEVVILVVENDSEDGTRDYLLKWAKEDNRVIVLGCGTNSPKCQLSLPKTVSHEHEQSRIQKMAFVRNIYLTHMKRYYSDYDFLVVWDFDRVGTLYHDSLWSSFGYFYEDQTKSVDGICSNGLKQNTLLGWLYYDPFAHQELEEDPIYLYHDWYVQAKMRTMLKKGHPLHKVRSCFGGMTVYRIPSIMLNDAEYDYSRTDEVVCEHVFFNNAMSMYVNPSMFYLVDSRPD